MGEALENDKKNIPEHVALIMDGNRRWSRERNLPTAEGHRRGYAVMRKCPEWFFEKGVKTVSVFAFSTENWNRSPDEVNQLMKLFEAAVKAEIDEIEKRKIRIVFSGRWPELPGGLPDLIAELEGRTKLFSGRILQICYNYGGRAEIVDMAKKIIEKKITIEQVHEGMLRKYLYHGELSDPDIIVRTSGEKRLSGFLLWGSAYCELMFMEKYWPDFERSDADKIIEEYRSRQRRFGGG